jgi:type I restriction-modification system DNA methylase subunit
VGDRVAAAEPGEAMNQQLADMEKILRRLAYRQDLYRIFSDFCELSAITLSNAVDLVHRGKREARYLQLVKHYNREEIDQFPRLFALLVEALERRGFADLLGELHARLELHNKVAGQYYTPYNVCLCMAKMMLIRDDTVNRALEERGFLTLAEPCVGSGALVIAAAEALHDEKINYQQQLHVTAVDIAATCVHMAYLQFTLLNIPAVVVLGDSLGGEARERWLTPAHIWGLWDVKLRRKPAPTATIVLPTVQLPLFSAGAMR